MAKAKFALADVFRLIDSSKVWFSAPSRSVNKVIQAYAGSANPKTQEDAERFILSGIKALNDDAFVTRAIQWAIRNASLISTG